MTTTPRLLYGIPSGGHPRLRWVWSTHRITSTQKSFLEYQFGGVEGLPVQMARHTLAMRMLEEGYDFLLMHDDDLDVSTDGPRGNPIDTFVDIFNRDPTVGVVGAVYLRKNPRTPPINAYVPGETDYRANIISGMPMAPFLVESMPTGFFMVRRALLEQMFAISDGPLFRFPDRPTRWGGVEEIGEDVDFCQRAWRLGWKVVVDPRIPTVHLKLDGDLPYEWSTWEGQETIKLELMPGCSAVQLPCFAMDVTRQCPDAQLWTEQLQQLLCIDVTEARRKESEAQVARRRVFSPPGPMPFLARRSATEPPHVIQAPASTADAELIDDLLLEYVPRRAA